MTAAEFLHCSPLPEKIAWMACHFSPYGTGLTNCPQQLPPKSLLILNDRTPICGHDPVLVAQQLCYIAMKLDCAGILLDLQRPGVEDAFAITQSICATAPCPVAVSEYYGSSVDAAVFLSPPLHIPLAEFLTPWQGREIWLEAAAEDVEFVITEAGCRQSPLPCPPETFPHAAKEAFSRYHISVAQDAVRFSFRRGKEDWAQLAEDGENIRCMVGLYQQLR